MANRKAYMKEWREDWNKFAHDVLHARLDAEQQEILHAIQHNPMVAVASGTSRGKDFVSAVAALCFMYLTPRFNDNGELAENTKVFMTAPTSRQVEKIMMPEVSRLFRAAKCLPGRELSSGITTRHKEWFLTGFKADDTNMEAWSGLHAANIMFVVTEASGMSELVFNAIEGNLQGNSRLLLVFNPNVNIGYAAKAIRSERFKSFRLSSLNAQNVVQKKVIIPGQVDYRWVDDHVKEWCEPIREEDAVKENGDFKWEGKWMRPNDLARVKILGMFPKVSEDTLIPYEWVEAANERWKKMQEEGYVPNRAKRIGVDIAGMGRDNSVLCPRYDNYVGEFIVHQSAGAAEHMHVAGLLWQKMDLRKDIAFIDTIGEGAGVYSRIQELNAPLLEQQKKKVFSCKFSEGAKNLHDITGQYEFVNMRAYLYWAIRDWLNPKNGFYPALPPDNQLMEELTNTKWKFQSNGAIIIEAKEDIRKRIKRSPDKADALANTFYPYAYTIESEMNILDIMRK